MYLPATPNQPGNPGPGSPFLPTRSQTGGVGMSRRGRQAADPGLAGPSSPAGSENGHLQGFWLSDVEALGKCLSAVPRVAATRHQINVSSRRCSPNPCGPGFSEVPGTLAQSGDVQGRRRVRKESRRSPEAVPRRVPPGPQRASLAASPGKGEELRLVHYVPL